ncbi:hypothetical protein FRC15_011725 [Serendipita sp. 397]|nr:hypothetical protein FRC15_011725 [Serendipita sp. 397]
MPQSCKTVDYTHKDRIKNHRYSSRKDQVPRTAQHLVEGLKSKNYFGTPGRSCPICDKVILRDHDLNRHLEKQHQIPRARARARTKKDITKAELAPFLTGDTTNASRNGARLAHSDTPGIAMAQPTSIVIKKSPHTTVVIGGNQNPAQNHGGYENSYLPPQHVPTRTGSANTFVHRQQPYMANLYRHMPYSVNNIKPLTQPPMPYGSWSHDSGVSGLAALTALQPNVFSPVEPFSQSLDLEGGLNQQNVGTSWMVSTVPADPTPVPYNGTPAASLQHWNSLPMQPLSSTPPIQAPPPEIYWSMNPTPVLYQGPIPWADRRMQYASRYAQKSTRSSDEQWEGVHTVQTYEAAPWCSSSDLRSRFADAFQSILVLLIAAGILMFLVFTLSTSLEEHAMDIQLLTLTF